MILKDIKLLPRKRRLKAVASTIVTEPSVLIEYLDIHTQKELADELELPESRLSDVLLVLKSAIYND